MNLNELTSASDKVLSVSRRGFESSAGWICRSEDFCEELSELLAGMWSVTEFCKNKKVKNYYKQ